MLRELHNQRGESIGFATAYNYTEKLKEKEIGQKKGKNAALKKTIDLIGDYFGD